MGLITGVLLLPFAGPVWTFRLVLERLHDEAEAVLRDEGRAFAELIDLSMRHNAGQLSDNEFAEQEAELLDRLSSIREYRDELLSDDECEDTGPLDDASLGEAEWVDDGELVEVEDEW